MASNKFYLKALCATTAMSMITLSGAVTGVMAQDKEEEKKGSAALIEEIAIYGTKRTAAQKAQDVPAQISAYSANKMDAMQIVRLTDLSMSTPSVTLDDIGTVPGTPNYSIRGMGVNSSIPSIDPAVAIFINGVYSGAGTGSILNMMDIEGVEIHKGPQGVLFGRNVTGGAILMRTARPTDEFSVKAKFGVETGPMTYGQLAMSGPLSDSLSGRVAIYVKEDKGFFESPNIGRKIGQESSLIVRPTLRYNPSENFDMTVVYEHGETTGDGPVDQAAAGGNPSMPYETGDTVQDFAGDIDLSWDQLTVEAVYNLNENSSLTNVFGYRKSDQSSTSDIDGSALYLFHSSSHTVRESYSNELRYNTRASEKWEITAGAYWEKSELNYDEGRSILSGLIAYGGGGDQKAEIWGLFLNNYVDLTDRLTLQAGVRYSWNNKTATLDALETCTFDYTCFATIDLPELKSDYMSAKVGLEYQASDDMKVYTHWARSYRAGGYNFRIPIGLVMQKLGAGEPLAFSPERLDSFEVGMKSSLMDGKVRLNGAAYLNYLNNMQREINLPSASGGVQQDIQNTGNARIFGMEFDALITVSNDTVINLGAGYIDGSYTDVSYDLNTDGVVNDADLALDIPRLAKWTLTAGISHDFDLGENGMLTARYDISYRSEAAYTDSNLGRFNPYTMMNAGLTYTPVDANWSLSVYGKNLSDEIILGGMTILPFGPFGAPYFAPMGKGRRYGAEVRMNF